jgi:hypothetical protein
MIQQQQSHQQQLNLCACGCRHPVTPGRRFIIGHNARVLSEESKKRMSLIARSKIGYKSPRWLGGHSDSYKRALKQRRT